MTTSLDGKTCGIAAKVLREHAGTLLQSNERLTSTATTDAGRDNIAEHVADQRAVAEACMAVADQIAPENELAWLVGEFRMRAIDCRNIAAKATFEHDEHTRQGMAEAYDAMADLILARNP